jgi:hypothetical protein
MFYLMMLYVLPWGAWSRQLFSSVTGRKLLARIPRPAAKMKFRLKLLRTKINRRKIDFKISLDLIFDNKLTIRQQKILLRKYSQSQD